MSRLLRNRRKQKWSLAMQNYLRKGETHISMRLPQSPREYTRTLPPMRAQNPRRGEKHGGSQIQKSPQGYRPKRLKLYEPRHSGKRREICVSSCQLFQAVSPKRSNPHCILIRFRRMTYSPVGTYSQSAYDWCRELNRGTNARV